MGKINLTIVPFHDYKKWINEGFRTRDAHLFEHFRKNSSINKILVINRPMSLVEMLVKRMNWKIKGQKVEYNKNGIQLTKIYDNVWCLDFILLDFFKVLFQRKKWWYTCFNYAKVINAINEAQEYLNFNNSILFLENPMAIQTVENVNHNSFVFDAIDNWLFHPQMEEKKLIEKNYKVVKEKANLILTVSKSLSEYFSENKNTYWIPNGVDSNYFKEAISTKINNPICIGYIGKIQDRINFNLVEKCLIAFPNLLFKFVGPIFSQHSQVHYLKKNYKNIVFLGDVHYNSLPKIMKEIDICIIPHYDNEFTQSMNPIKIYEYIASGKPVVTSNIAGVEKFDKIILKSNCDREFISNIEKILKKLQNNEIDFKNIAKKVPKESEWSSISDRIVKLMGEINNE